MSLLTYLPMKMEQTDCSETSAYKIQTPGNCPEENIQHHVEMSATGRSLVRKSPSECGVSECDQGTSKRKPRPTRAVEP